MKRVEQEERLIPIRDESQLALFWDSTQGAYERALQKVHGGEHQKVILVVSAIHGEGVSTVSRNLATTATQGGRQEVLLVDANLRTPNQHLAFGISAGEGLSEVLSGTLEVDDAIANGCVSGLSLITCGRPTQSSASVFDFTNLKDMIDKLMSRFDMIIIDGPPVTVYGDVEILASVSDGIVLVVQAERTRWEVANHAKLLLEKTGTPILGAVLNRRRLHIPDFIYRLMFK
jgi:capsular exopolysaccharide synthesis family protein